MTSLSFAVAVARFEAVNDGLKKKVGSGVRKKKSDTMGPVASAAGVFLIALLALACALLAVLGVRSGELAGASFEPLIPLGIYAVGIPLLLVWLRAIGWRGDAGILGAVILLSGLGLLVQFRMGSFSSGLASLQSVVPFAVGLAAFAVGAALTQKGKGAWMQPLGWVAYLAALGVFGAVMVLGRSYRGGLYLPGNISPTEVVKPLLVLFLAMYLGRNHETFSEARAGIPMPSFPALLGLVALWGVPMAITIYQRDLGMVALLNAILIVMLFAAGKRMGYLALGLAGVAAAGYGMQFLSSHAQVRFDIWLNPFEDPTGKGWQILQGLAAMYSGGWWGAGLGGGAPQAVPIVTSDFVYAAVAEEIGLVGCALLLAAYAVLFSRGFRAAGGAWTPFERLLCVGLTASLAVQALFNVAGVTKALPMTGITLPFISHGGSSLITCLFVAGLVCGLSDNE